ncbi:dienelactone hydrolase family protein [Actinocorallia populi]|uniref:dienelactone hydrolase family protein n=1 Tax=Actinocorallia populi TaxID=2079200 RepID=UPI000D094CDC|nr:dienelactone hydrolase family protein [Actinocorallia populi]
MSEMPEPSGSETRQNVAFPSGEGTAHGYLALPPGGSGPGVLVIQEWWGLNDHIADVTERLAREGFVALAPDLFGGSVAHDPDEARRMTRRLPVERGVRLLSGAVGYLLELPETTSTGVGAVGFCMGGAFVLRLAAADPRVTAAVSFYGAMQEIPDFSRLRAQVLGHYGTKDRSITPEALERLRAALNEQAGIDPEIHIYPAGHAFFNDARPSYHAESAEHAWTTTLAFLHRLLG